jgi:type III pantothenate kinase
MDVGNSNTVFGLYEDSSFREHWRVVTTNYRTSDELHILFSMLLQTAGVRLGDISGCCISSVVPQMNNPLQQVCREVFKVEPIMVGPGVKTGLAIRYGNPKDVGADRIANAVGGLSEYKGAILIVDFGTATTFDVVTEQGEFCGGVIVPGIQLSADALFERCARLPRVDIKMPPTVIGRDTVSNIQSGLTYGYADLVDGLTRRICDEMGTAPTIVATGGLAQTIADVSTRIDVVDPLLTLKGLRTIFIKNSQESV